MANIPGMFNASMPFPSTDMVKAAELLVEAVPGVALFELTEDHEFIYLKCLADHEYMKPLTTIEVYELQTSVVHDRYVILKAAISVQLERLVGKVLTAVAVRRAWLYSGPRDKLLEEMTEMVRDQIKITSDLAFKEMFGDHQE